MKKEAREALDAYFTEADSWAKDRNDALRKSNRTAWIVAVAAVIVALALALTLMLLMPLKEVETHTIMVDRNTGFVQEVNPLDPQRLSGDTALTQAFLAQYVTAREGFDIATIDNDYRKVATWSAERARTDYLNWIPATNPDSPLVRYPRTTIVQTQVKSVSPLEPGVAMVRFQTVRRDAGGQVSEPSHWVAIVRYRYSGEPMRIEERLINPLGFQVTGYRRDAEAPPPPDPVPTAPAQAPTGNGPAPAQAAGPQRTPPPAVVPPQQPRRPCVMPGGEPC